LVSLRSLLEGPTPRPLLIFGTPIAAVVLISTFVFLQFPYDAFAPPLGHQLSAATGADVRIGGIDPRLTIGGPGIAARDVIVLTPQGQPISIDPLRIRPAWSTSWFSGRPALHIDLVSEIGEANGTLHVGEPMGWAGELHGVDLARLPISLPSGVALSGMADANIELELAEGSLSGNIQFTAQRGALNHPNLPLEIDFEEFGGELQLGGERMAEIKSIALDGETIRASASGVVAKARRNGRNPLDLNLDVEIKNPGMATMLRSMGIQLDEQGKVSVKIGGSLQNPSVR
jgi:type II secretion system protein N